MSFTQSDSYSSQPTTVANASLADRLDFIRDTYLHLGLAIFAFIGIEWFMFQTGIAHTFANFIFSA